MHPVAGAGDHLAVVWNHNNTHKQYPKSYIQSFKILYCYILLYIHNDYVGILYTTITEVNLSRFVYRLFCEVFTSLVRTDHQPVFLIQILVGLLGVFINPDFNEYLMFCLSASRLWILDLDAERQEIRYLLK